MKKQLILLVAFCATCINAYAFNYSAGKTRMQNMRLAIFKPC